MINGSGPVYDNAANERAETPALLRQRYLTGPLSQLISHYQIFRLTLDYTCNMRVKNNDPQTTYGWMDRQTFKILPLRVLVGAKTVFE